MHFVVKKDSKEKLGTGLLSSCIVKYEPHRAVHAGTQDRVILIRGKDELIVLRDGRCRFFPMDGEVNKEEADNQYLNVEPLAAGDSFEFVQYSNPMIS